MGADVVFVLSSLFLSFCNHVHFASANEPSPKENPFTPKASLMRYWSSHIDTPVSPFLLSKASPLEAISSATFAKLAAQNALSAHLPTFCSSAKLFCFFDLSPSLVKYSKDSNFGSYGLKFDIYGGILMFKNYSESEAQDTFRRYSRNAQDHRDKFSEYAPGANTADDKFNTYGAGAKKWVEPGKFFRESMLKEGNVMPMSDIRDKMPRRSFLPRSITSKLPFSTAQIAQLNEMFNATDNPAMETIILDALKECERAPSRGETKRCVGSAEDLIDFATSVLGRNAMVRTTQNVNGSKKNIMIGKVEAIIGEKVTESVSCHQSMYPYLLYYCHSVPNVRVYEADILEPNSKANNHGVAICHLDTSAWDSSHGAFLALGSSPGKIEVCHWIFENDMTWTLADEF